MKKATKLQLLEFINDSDFVRAPDLMNHFGYTRGGAYSTLGWLKSLRLIVNDSRGVYTITDEGIKKLIYYGRV